MTTNEKTNHLRKNTLKRNILLLFVSALSAGSLFAQNYFAVTYTPFVNAAGVQINKCFKSNISIIAGFEKNIFENGYGDNGTESTGSTNLQFTKIYAGIGKKLDDLFIMNMALDYYSFNEIGADVGIVFRVNRYLHVVANVDILAWTELTSAIYIPKIGIGVNF